MSELSLSLWRHPARPGLVWFGLVLSSSSGRSSRARSAVAAVGGDLCVESSRSSTAGSARVGSGRSVATRLDSTRRATRSSDSAGDAREGQSRASTRTTRSRSVGRSVQSTRTNDSIDRATRRRRRRRRLAPRRRTRCAQQNSSVLLGMVRGVPTTTSRDSPMRSTSAHHASILFPGSAAEGRARRRCARHSLEGATRQS